MKTLATRRSFLKAAALGAAATASAADTPKIQGFEEEKPDGDPSAGWKPVSDRKVRMGIVGYGVCKFGARFYLQDHPNVDVVAVSDLFPDRCAALALASVWLWGQREQLGPRHHRPDWGWAQRSPYRACTDLLCL